MRSSSASMWIPGPMSQRSTLETLSNVRKEFTKVESIVVHCLFFQCSVCQPSSSIWIVTGTADQSIPCSGTAGRGGSGGEEGVGCGPRQTACPTAGKG